LKQAFFRVCVWLLASIGHMAQMISSEQLNHLFLSKNYEDKACFLWNNVQIRRSQ